MPLQKKIFFTLFACFCVLLVYPQQTQAFTGSGSGTDIDPYIITDCEELQEIEDDLTADYRIEPAGDYIDCRDTEDWNEGQGFAPIGADTSGDSSRFTGSLDGNQSIIYGLYINVAGGSTLGTGLFGAVGTTGRITELGIVDAVIHSNAGYVGTLVGQNYGTLDFTFASSTVTGGSFKGILVGVNRGPIRNSYTQGTLAGSGNYNGGLAGFNASSIRDSFSSAVVNTLSTSGGVVGRTWWSSTLVNIISASFVTGTSKGGIEGARAQNGTITNGYWSSVLSGQDDCIIIESGGTSNVGCTDVGAATTTLFDIDGEPYISFASGTEHLVEYASHMPTFSWHDPEYTFPPPDVTAPIISTLVPADNATGVSITSTFVITFDESIVTSTGNILIYKSSDNSVVETIAVTSSLVTASSTTALVIDPSVTLSYNTSYYILIDATAIDDTSANSFAGISVSTTWNFTTENLSPPSALAYTTPNTYTVNTAIATLSPIVTGVVTSFAVSPALPTGIILDPATGNISGTPVVVVGETVYTVTASNSGGETTFDITITVNSAEEEDSQSSSGRGGNTYSSENPLTREQVNEWVSQEDRDEGNAQEENQEPAPGQPTVPAIPIDENQELQCTSNVYLTNPVRFGAENNPADVRLLEEFLNTYENAGLEVNGIYEQADFDAVVTWQEKYAASILAPWGLTRGTGYVYTTSLAKIKEIHEANCATARPAAQATPVSVEQCLETNQALVFGMSNVLVATAQRLLQTLGYFPADVTPTGYFGSITEAAVRAFQASTGIEQVGIIGPQTRATLNQLGC